MSAEPLRAPGPEMEQPPAPAQEAASSATLNEALTGVSTPEAPREPESFREMEDRAAREGMAKLNELGKNLNLQAETGTREIKEKTKSWWDRAKGVFKKKEGALVKGEEEVLGEIEKADAVYAEFKRKYDEVMTSGDEAALRGLEGSLSQAYDQLAPQVAAEGAAESKQWKKALKTGEMPPTTETGAKLNDVTRRLMEVRGRLNGVAPAKADNGLDEAIGRGVAEYEAEQGIAPETISKPDKAATERSQLMKDSAGKPGEKMVDEYLKLRDLKADAYGEIIGSSFEPINQQGQGEIRLKYKDGSEFRKYSTGLMLRIRPGEKGEEIIKSEPIPQAETAPTAPVEGTDENPTTESVVSGEIDTEAELPVEDSQNIEETAEGEAPFSVEPGPDIEVSPAPEVLTQEPLGREEMLMRRKKGRFNLGDFNASADVAYAKLAHDEIRAAEKAMTLLRQAGLEGSGEYKKEEERKLRYGEMLALTPKEAHPTAEDDAQDEAFNTSLRAINIELGAKGLKKDKRAELEERFRNMKYAQEGRKARKILQVAQAMNLPSADHRLGAGLRTGDTVYTRRLPDQALEGWKIVYVPDFHGSGGRGEAVIQKEGGDEMRLVEPGELATHWLTPEKMRKMPGGAGMTEARPEKKEFPMDKLEVSVADIASKLLPLAKAFETPKTYGTKVVAKMAPAEFLKLFTDNGKISTEEAASIAEELKTDSKSLEDFNAVRKKLVAAINKLAR